MDTTIQEEKKRKFQFFSQLEQKDCGPTCLKMLAAYYGRKYPLIYLGQICYAGRVGATMEGLVAGAETLGLQAFGASFTIEELLVDAPMPAILYWKKKHFVVLVGRAKGRKKNTHVIIADPERGKKIMPIKALEENWLSGGTEGYALVAEPTDTFYTFKADIPEQQGFWELPIWKLLTSFKKYFAQIALAMLITSVINLFFPILTQQLVDNGVQRKNISLIGLLLLAQIALFVGNMLVEIVRSWVMLYINARVNIQIVSAFLIKLIKLPISFFDNRLMTDIMLRIDDHDRIESFFSSSSLNVVFSFFTVIVLSVLFCMYSPLLFLLFVVISAISMAWVLYFMKRRKAIDYAHFELMGESNNMLYEIIDGMCEIKLNNAEKTKRFEWERKQVEKYGINRKSLYINQLQDIGFSALTQLKNFAITFAAAYSVVKGDITLGVMLSITMLASQINHPLESFVEFFQSLQNARISLERLNDVYARRDEEETHQHSLATVPTNGVAFNEDAIVMQNISFSYNGALGPNVFNELSLEIPLHKVTAIVGGSGSGKTTLFKLLLKFYDPNKGNIAISGKKIQHIHPDKWRSQCGVVMQDGYIFSDTILRNIAVNDATPNMQRVEEACRLANILTYIEELPLTFRTLIGGSGTGLSAGQKQRILIARAVYKNPDFLFFDEATSALDAHNEKIIIENLEQFYKGKTVLIIAHRLSTVKHADKIVVLEKGRIVEQDTHAALVKKQGFYYTLIKNQLELGT